MTGEQQSLLMAGHVGAAAEEYSWDIADPGYYELVGPKGAGKSTLLRVMELLSAAPEDLASQIPITHGEDTAYFQLDARRLEVKLSPTGELCQPIVTGPEVTVDPIPAAIRTLVDGDRCVKPDTRAEHRLRALLSYAPVQTSAEFLTALLGCLVLPAGPGLPAKARAFGEIPRPLRELWWELTRPALAQKKLKSYEQLRDPAEIRAWLEEQPATKRRGSILDDHGLLVGLLNASAKTGDHAATEQAGRLREIEGRLRQAAAGAARQLGIEVDSGLQARLQEEHDLETLRKVASQMRGAAGELRTQRAARLAEERRREELRASPLFAGGRPEIDGSKVEALAAQIAADEKAVEVAGETVASFQAAADTTKRETATAARHVHRVWKELDDYCIELALKIFDDDGYPVPPAESTVRFGTQFEVGRGTRLLTVLAEAVEQDPKAAADQATQVLEASQQARDGLRDALMKLREEKATEDGRVATVKQDQARYDETTALLAQPIPGPEQADVDAAESQASEADAAVKIAEAASGYQAIAAEHRAALENATAIEELCKAYRGAKDASWTYLGEVVTSALPKEAQSFVMVDGTDIFFGYLDGKLNTDPALIEAARKTARDQIAAASTGGNVIAHPRFLERVREASQVEWRNIDDNETAREAGWMLSEAELAEACMAVWFSGQPDGAVRTVPPSISGTFDEATLLAFDDECKRRGMRVFGARPRHDGDPSGLHLVKVGAS